MNCETCLKKLLNKHVTLGIWGHGQRNMFNEKKNSTNFFFALILINIFFMRRTSFSDFLSDFSVLGNFFYLQSPPLPHLS